MNEQQTSARLEAQADRIRILEAQVDHLRAELEYLEARHHRAIYSVAWHAASPIRWIEQWIRSLLQQKRQGDALSLPTPDRKPSDAQKKLNHEKMTAEKIAARINARISASA